VHRSLETAVEIHDKKLPLIKIMPFSCFYSKKVREPRHVHEQIFDHSNITELQTCRTEPAQTTSELPDRGRGTGVKWPYHGERPYTLA